MKKILVVDDEESIRIILKQMLEKGGYSVVVAGNGKEAAEMLKIIHFDAIISDIHMPIMDGVELLNKVKELTPDVPVIFITAYGKDKVVIEAMKIGLADFIDKPFRMDQILKTVKEHIKS